MVSFSRGRAFALRQANGRSAPPLLHHVQSIGAGEQIDGGLDRKTERMAPGCEPSIVTPRTFEIPSGLWAVRGPELASLTPHDEENPCAPISNRHSQIADFGIILHEVEGARRDSIGETNHASDLGSFRQQHVRDSDVHLAFSLRRWGDRLQDRTRGHVAKPELRRGAAEATFLPFEGRKVELGRIPHQDPRVYRIGDVQLSPDLRIVHPTVGSSCRIPSRPTRRARPTSLPAGSPCSSRASIAAGAHLPTRPPGPHRPAIPRASDVFLLRASQRQGPQGTPEHNSFHFFSLHDGRLKVGSAPDPLHARPPSPCVSISSAARPRLRSNGDIPSPSSTRKGKGRLESPGSLVPRDGLFGGRWWFRTTDPRRVKTVLYR